MSDSLKNPSLSEAVASRENPNFRGIIGASEEIPYVRSAMNPSLSEGATIREDQESRGLIECPYFPASLHKKSNYIRERN
jgi:hypothetical protein